MKTMRNRNSGGGRSISPIPSNYGKAGYKTAQQSKRRPQSKSSPKNKRSNRPAPGNPRETGADSYQASARSQRRTSFGKGKASFGKSPTPQIQPRLTSLNPAKVADLIHELSDLRETLAPQVPTSIPAGQRHFVTPEPLWEISAEVREDGKVLLIRHPGLGWLGFIIPHDDCERLAGDLG